MAARVSTGSRVSTARAARSGLLFALGAASCASAGAVAPNSPRQTAEAHVAAARAGDAAGVRATLHPAARADVTDAELGRTAAIPGYAADPDLVVLDGDLRFDCVAAGPCRLSSPLPRFDLRDSPDAALRLLGRALRASDATALRELAPAQLRATLTPDRLMQRLVEGAPREVWLAALAELDGSGQWLLEGAAFARRVSAGHEASFAREADGGWVLVDLR